MGSGFFREAPIQRLYQFPLFLLFIDNSKEFLRRKWFKNVKILSAGIPIERNLKDCIHLEGLRVSTAGKVQFHWHEYYLQKLTWANWVTFVNEAHLCFFASRRYFSSQFSITVFNIAFYLEYYKSSFFAVRYSTSGK